MNRKIDGTYLNFTVVDSSHYFVGTAPISEAKPNFMNWWGCLATSQGFIKGNIKFKRWIFLEQIGQTQIITLETITLFFANSPSRSFLIPTLFVRTGICSEVKPNWMNGWVCSFVFQKDLPSEISNLKKMQIFVKQMEHNEILLTLLCMGSQN